MAPSPLSRFIVTPNRIRSYVLRLPLATRLLLAITLAVYVATWFVSWIPEWGSLIPSEIGLQSMYRLNFYPFLHTGLVHLVFNIAAVTPLLERFETEYGTLNTLILFTGPMGSLPGILYTILSYYILRVDTPVMGSSVWVFILLSYEALKPTPNTHITLGPYRIPTWTTPLLLILIVSFLLPAQTSLIGHLCAAAIGYVCGMGYIKYLLPPERILRWVEQRLNLLQRIPHYVSVDQKVYGRYGILPSTTSSATLSGGQRLGSAPAAFVPQFTPSVNPSLAAKSNGISPYAPMQTPAVVINDASTNAASSSTDTTSPVAAFKGPGQRVGGPPP